MEGLCLQRSASDSAQDRLGQPAGHSSSTDGNVNVINIISNLNIEEKRYQKISGFFFLLLFSCPCPGSCGGRVEKP